MAKIPEIALLVSTYQRPRHLQRALLSIAMQRDAGDKMEVVVTDDGSTDETAELVEKFSKTVDFPVRVYDASAQRVSIIAVPQRRGAGQHGRRICCFWTATACCRRTMSPFNWRAGSRSDADRKFYSLNEATSARIDEQAIRSGEFYELGSGRGIFAKHASKDVAALFMNGCGIPRNRDCWATTLAFGEAITSKSMASMKTLRVGVGKTMI